ncbi:hypothetical protein [Paenibacillus sp. sptzw28]|nr:hypothetical protein [Paenibacillus sp. sptzw28]
MAAKGCNNPEIQNNRIVFATCESPLACACGDLCCPEALEARQ